MSFFRSIPVRLEVEVHDDELVITRGKVSGLKKAAAMGVAVCGVLSACLNKNELGRTAGEAAGIVGVGTCWSSVKLTKGMKSLLGNVPRQSSAVLSVSPSGAAAAASSGGLNPSAMP